MDDKKWDLSKSFTVEFQTARSDLESQIESAKISSSVSESQVQKFSLELSRLSKTLADATGALPSYDQKTYELQLKALESAIESLRDRTNQKPKFSFKRKAQAPASTSPSPAPVIASATTTSVPASDPVVTSHSTPTRNTILTSQSNQYLTISSLSGHEDLFDLSISNLDNCIVDLLPNAALNTGPISRKISVVHARNLTKCVLFLPPIDGSALLHDLTDCIIVLNCHQFRMHSSRNVDVFISISSTPIIEDCRAIQFSHWPNTLPETGPTTATSDLPPPPPLSVQDFSHIRSTPSPNFSILSNEQHDKLTSQLQSFRDTTHSPAEHPAWTSTSWFGA